MAVQYIQPLVTPEVIDMIREKVLPACDEIPDQDEASMCKEQVNKYIDLLSKMIHEQPDQICAEIGMCPKKSSLLSQLIGAKYAMFQQAGYTFNVNETVSFWNSQFFRNIAGPVSCESCKLMTQQVQSFLNNKRNVDQVQKVFDTICKELDRNDFDNCHQISHAYWSETVKFITQQSPEALCSIVGACVPPPGAKGCQMCESCEKAVNEMKQFLKDQNNVGKIEHKIHKICDSLPVGQSQCVQSLESVLDNFKQMLESHSSHDICVHYHLCKQ